MRARSHRYPRLEDGFIDTSYYDKDDEYFDLGYQLQKKINIDSYPQFLYLKKLFIDHNKLTFLPDTVNLPNLEYLNCSYNLLTSIPYYPKLTFLNISNNNIITLDKYHKSKITYLDCGYNKGLHLDFKLPYCEHLYTNSNELETINLKLFPNIHFLDCSDNDLHEINGGGDELLEINVQNNKLTSLPECPKLLRLMADRNEIKILRTYPELKSITITFNALKVIYHQPKLKKIIANDNYIEILGEMPKLTIADFSYNQLKSFTTPSRAHYISVQFNPLNNFIINPNSFKHIRELQINFETYSHIYKKYYHKFKFINIQTNGEILKGMLQKLASHKFFDQDTISFIFEKMMTIKFKERNKIFYFIAIKIYKKYYKTKNNPIIDMFDFDHLCNTIAKFYYKTIVITLYFEGYFD